MRSLTTPSLVALSVALLLASLSLVTWRQSRARAGLARLDEIERERSLAESELAELRGRVQHLESRSRVVSAGRELGLHIPAASEIQLLRRPGGLP